MVNTQGPLKTLGGWMETQNSPCDLARFRVSVSPQEPAEFRSLRIASGTANRPRAALAAGGTIRLLVVDDHEVVREAFIGLLNRQEDFQVVGEAADGEEAVRQVALLHPDVVLMDVDMPKMNGIEATRCIKQQQTGSAVIGLSLHEEKSVTRAMAEAGAETYVSKQAPGEDLVETIRRVCSSD